MKNAIDNSPAFWGVIGEGLPEVRADHALREEVAEGVSKYEGAHVQLVARELNGWPQAHWKSHREGRGRLDIFVWGWPMIAGDVEFGKDTEVHRAEPNNLCELVGDLYAQYGTGSFARLEGNFSLLISDVVARKVFLVVDKYGCDDVFIRVEQKGLRFGSHPEFLPGVATQFISLTTAFFLAHEGFVPAPFTLFEGIKTLGRGRFLRYEIGEHGPHILVERYWRPSRTWDLKSRSQSIDEFSPILRRAVKSRFSGRTGLLLSGGTDSSLLANLMAERDEREFLALTGGIVSDPGSEREIRVARTLASALGIPHEAVILDPFDESLPDEWARCVQSWVGGTRITLPLFYRFAIRQRQAFGDGCGIFSGQMADTLADNNYTLPSPGYLVRRGFFSAKFLKLLPLFQGCSKRTPARFRKWLIGMAQVCAGSRTARMLESVLDGLTNSKRFYDGRVFGYGEMPGRSLKYFPALTGAGFECVAEWYSDFFVQPFVAGLEEEDFYSAMIEMSMDMVMLHLDTRLVFQALRLGGARAEMPFLDSRVVNFFVSLPNSARRLHHEPKHVIQAQFEKPNMIRFADGERSRREHKEVAAASSEELLLHGTLGEYLREILATPTFAHQVPGIFEFIDENYLSSQLDAFVRSAPGINYKFMSRLGALEMWCRMASADSHSALFARATA